MVQKTITALYNAGLMAFIAGIVALMGGTVLWLLWPVAIPAVFPAIVSAGYIAGKLSWWNAICFFWILSLLFKSNINTTPKE